jgi:hypothetical protein
VALAWLTRFCLCWSTTPDRRGLVVITKQVVHGEPTDWRLAHDGGASRRRTLPTRSLPGQPGFFGQLERDQRPLPLTFSLAHLRRIS